MERNQYSFSIANILKMCQNKLFQIAFSVIIDAIHINFNLFLWKINVGEITYLNVKE